jgi:hypothetical protein
MSNHQSLYRRLAKIKENMPPVPISTIPCLVPPPDMHLFTEQEQHALQELESRVVPLIRTDSDSWIWQYGGPHVALFRLSPAMSRPFVEGVNEKLSVHEKWFLKRWHEFYFNMAVHGFSSERWEHQRRHFFRTPEELIERFLSIDLSRCPERFYPLDYIGHAYMVCNLEGKDNRPLARGPICWDWLELWYDFSEECPDIVSIQ